MKLTPTQKAILWNALKKGKLRHEDFREFYTTNSSIREAIERFLICGLIKETQTAYFELNVDKIKAELE